MRVDLLSIFPDYLAPLGLSLLGRAQADGLLSVHTHDLRDWTHDRHRTVDDAPYGGGAGMVMRPEPWGEALDDLLAHDSAHEMTPTLVVPSPAGSRFEQRTAATLATRPWLLFACGRYEGIDQRVSEHFSQRMEVLELSVGDYVLGGGEAAALVMIEAVARLLPGFVGNPTSIVDESHCGAAPGLLEYPVYTRPPTWRGIDVPGVLLSGDHGRIAAWRRREAVRRTAQRRPDLVHPSQTLRVADLETLAQVGLATPADAGELLTLQRCCWVSEAQLNEAGLKEPLRIPPLVESLDDVRSGLVSWLTVTVRVDGRLVASVRGRLGTDQVWEIGRLMVAPDLEGRGLGRWLLAHIEQAAPAEATSYALLTGARSERNLRMYAKAGYRQLLRGGSEPEPGVATLVKKSPPPSDFE